MKLFQCDYTEDDDNETYLTVGEDSDTETTIRGRELKRISDWSCLYFFGVREIKAVDGYKITVE